MSIYVDELIEYPAHALKPRVRRAGTFWCHMTADSTTELHRVAEKIGLKRSWFQPHSRRPHYDLVPSKRKLAIGLGAFEGRAAPQAPSDTLR